MPDNPDSARTKANYDNPGIYDNPLLTYDGEVISEGDDMPQYLKAAWARAFRFSVVRRR